MTDGNHREEAIGPDLDTHHPLTGEQIEGYRERGYIKLQGVLSPATLSHFRDAITGEVERLSAPDRPMEERTTYERAFRQVTNLWTRSEIVRAFVFSRKLARLAAELMGVPGVRLYHDQALYKEPGGGFTPWHADQYYWPLSGPNTCTAWVPLQDTPLEMGPLAFSVSSHRFQTGRDLGISDESEARISRALLEEGLATHEGPYGLGDVSFHSGWTFHRAGPNATDRPRRVMTVIYMEDGIRLAQPRNKNQEADRDAWMPGVEPGQPVQSSLNPLLYRG